MKEILKTDLSWDEVYKHWQYGSIFISQQINKTLEVKQIYVKYDGVGYFYGYDWLLNDDAEEREQLIERRPLDFIYFTKASNKGTIQTAEMLALAQSEEERVAIWIAATTFEIMQKYHSKVLYDLNFAALRFLSDKYYNWHHAMRKLIPDVMIPYSVLENCNLKDIDAVIGLIQMNTLLLISNYRILLYSSLKGEEPESFLLNPAEEC